MMMKHVLGIGEYAITQGDQDELVTYALGSCVAVVIYCPQQKMAAMAHVALPERLRSAEVGRHKPAYFADEAIPLLLERFRRSCNLSSDQLHVHLVGGAESRSEKDPFQVGPRNLEKIKALLRAQGLRYTAVDVGGHMSRTVTFDLGTSELLVKSQNML